jgi:hypothetical protein
LFGKSQDKVYNHPRSRMSVFRVVVTASCFSKAANGKSRERGLLCNESCFVCLILCRDLP